MRQSRKGWPMPFVIRHIITRLFVREGFYDYQKDKDTNQKDTQSANGTHNGTQSEKDGYESRIVSMIYANNKITRKQMQKSCL